MENPEILPIARMLLIYLHVLAFAVAAVAVAFGDFAIFARSRIDMPMLARASSIATAALCALWLTGLAVITMDIGLDLEALAAKPKLLAKLTVVVVLCLNSLALHRLAFPRLAVPQADALQAASLPAVFGAISATSWLYAAFVGVAKPLAAVLGYGGFIGLFVVLLSGAILLALISVRPRLASRMIAVPCTAGVAAG